MEFMAECSQNKRPPLPKGIKFCEMEWFAHILLVNLLSELILTWLISGFDAQVDEVRKCVLSYTQLVNYNRRVYGPFYAEILRALSEQSES